MNKTSPTITSKIGKVSYINTKGYGILFEDNKKIELPFCLAGEKVSFDEVKRRRTTDYYFREVITPSADRNQPPCQHFSECGGCMLQHMKTQEYKDFKKKIVIDAFITNNLDSFVIEDPIVLPHGLRRRANMDAIKKEDGTYLGFHRLKSHAVLNIEKCIVLDAELDAILTPLRSALDHVLNCFQKAKIFMTKTHVGIDVSIEIQNVSELTNEQIDILKQFALKQNLCRLLFKYRKKIHVIFEKEQPYVKIDDIKIPVNPWSFLQSSEEADQQLIHFVLSHVPKKQQHIIDLFCGRGTFTLPLSRYGSVDAYENDLESLTILESVALENKKTIQTFKRNLFDDPLTVQELNQADLVVIDPPRAGALRQCEELAKSSVPKIIYVSCNPETFARDMNLLQKNGYTLKKTYILDQFIYTTHVETVSIIEK